jgi:pantetheine-phosphate adenylyltransferase
MTRKAIFPGSFDPFTKGHYDIVMRGLALFDEIIIAIGYNTTKKRYFDLELIKSKIEGSFKDYPNVKVIVYSELTSYLALKEGAHFLLRGLRNTTDFEYEKSISQVNRHLNNNLDTVFIISRPEFAAISSSIVRELHKYGSPIHDFLPYSL